MPIKTYEFEIPLHNDKNITLGFVSLVILSEIVKLILLFILSYIEFNIISISFIDKSKFSFMSLKSGFKDLFK